jgi:hypothetical protein
MPMLDEAEYQTVASKRRLQASSSLREQFSDALDEFERITGFGEENPNAIWHHRLSLYGPPCTNCGKPLRTPHAKLCGSCMMPVIS